MVASTNSGWLQQGLLGSMLSDEELGKKDDDHPHHFKPARRHTHGGFSLRWRRKRVLLAVLALVVFSIVMHYTPSSASSSAQTPTGKKSSHANPLAYRPSRPDETKEPTGAPLGMRAPKRGQAAPHSFDGVFKFYRLARSLRGAAHTDGYRKVNRNVLFAVSSLGSASTLLPLVCDMALRNRNWVHAAFIGREDVPLEAILDINGVDRDKCPAIWHDARPDYTEYSSDERAEASVQAALTHIQTFLHPQVVIVDDERNEDAFFVHAVRNRTAALEVPLIEVPKGKWDDFSWLTRLDAAALQSWHRPTIDIVVQVPPDSSSVLHLLTSLAEADYAGLAVPRITLELPAALDSSVERALESFAWPPKKHSTTTTTTASPSQLVLRRRVVQHPPTPQDAAIRALELFYPATANAHLLLLSPHAQLSPLYLHYLTYLLLAYRYSDEIENMMGLTLDLPSLLVDAKTPLIPPTVADLQAPLFKKLPKDTPVPFLMQAPTPHATLFFADKWSEFHSFLSHRVAKLQQPQNEDREHPKLVSETLPSWTEYMLEFMRARAYALLYPPTRGLVALHAELSHPPEEFPHDSSSTRTPRRQGALVGRQPLHHFLHDLPDVDDLPFLLHNGSLVDAGRVAVLGARYTRLFSEEVGGCRVPAGKKKIRERGAGDLFCFGGEEGEDEWEDEWLLAGEVSGGALKTSTTSTTSTASTASTAQATPTEAK